MNGTNPDLKPYLAHNSSRDTKIKVSVKPERLSHGCPNALTTNIINVKTQVKRLINQLTTRFWPVKLWLILNNVYNTGPKYCNILQGKRYIPKRISQMIRKLQL